MPPVASGVGVGAAVAVAAGVSVGSAVCMGVGYIHGEVSVGTGVGVARLGRLVGFAVGFTVAVGLTVAVGFTVAVAVGLTVGFAVAVGSAVGAAVGFAVCVGCAVGVGVGSTVGSAVGSAVGCSGSAVSLISGVGVGSAAFEPPLALLSIIISAMFSAALSISSTASMPIVRLNARLVLIIVIASLPFYSASALAISAAMYCPCALSAAYSSASLSATEYTLSLTSSP